MNLAQEVLRYTEFDSPYMHDGDYHGNYSDPNIPAIVKDLKSLNIRAKSGYSIYEDHKMLLIHRDDFTKAIKALKNMGHTYISESLYDFYTELGKKYLLK